MHEHMVSPTQPYERIGAACPHQGPDHTEIVGVTMSCEKAEEPQLVAGEEENPIGIDEEGPPRTPKRQGKEAERTESPAKTRKEDIDAEATNADLRTDMRHMFESSTRQMRRVEAPRAHAPFKRVDGPRRAVWTFSWLP